MAQSQVLRSANPPSMHSYGQSPYQPTTPTSRLPSQSGSINSYTYGVPNRSYSGVSNPQGSMSHYQTVNSIRGSSVGSRSQSRTSSHYPSRSLGASKASIVSLHSGKSSIRQEYHDRQVRGNILAPFYGKGRTPFLIAVALLIIGCLFVIGGGVVFGLRFHNNIMLSVDKGEIFGPLLIAFGILCYAGAIKFYYDAYRTSNLERKKLKFSAANESMITVSTVSSRNLRYNQALVSGSASENAVTRTPQGSSRPAPTQV